MTPCAKINIFINAEGNPTVQFEPTEEFTGLPPLKRAMMAHAAVQIGTLVVRQIISENPECSDDICEHILASSLEQGTPRPN